MDNAEAEQLVIMEAVRSDRSPTGVQGVPTCMYINLMVCGLKPQTHQLIVDSRLQHSYSFTTHSYDFAPPFAKQGEYWSWGFVIVEQAAMVGQG